MNRTVSLHVSDPRLGSFPKKLSSVVRAAAVAAPLLGLSATLQPQETLAKTAQANKPVWDGSTYIIRGEINTNNCLGIQSVRNGTRVIVTPCEDNAVQTSWFFHNGALGNIAQGLWCVVSKNRVLQAPQLLVGSCDEKTAVKWELAGGKFRANNNLCLDAENGVNSTAVLRGCAAEVGSVRDPRRADQYWSLVETR